jgi:hypothetical protein
MERWPLFKRRGNVNVQIRTSKLPKTRREKFAALQAERMYSTLRKGIPLVYPRVVGHHHPKQLPGTGKGREQSAESLGLALILANPPILPLAGRAWTKIAMGCVETSGSICTVVVPAIPHPTTGWECRSPVPAQCVRQLRYARWACFRLLPNGVIRWDWSAPFQTGRSS